MKLNVVFWSSKKNGNASRFKDQIPIYMNSNVIYKYKCNICNNVYIIETKRHLLDHEYEHLGRSIPTGKPLKYQEKGATAVKKHCHLQNYSFDSFWFSLIVNTTNTYNLYQSHKK